MKDALLKLRKLHENCVELVNRGLSDTGGVMGDVLREHVNKLQALKDELEQETKKVMDIVGDMDHDDITDAIARRVNCDLWLNASTGLVQDCEKHCKDARAKLNEDEEDDSENASSKTSSSSTKGLSPKGLATLRKLRSDLDSIVQFVSSTTAKMKVLVTKIAAKVGFNTLIHTFFFLLLLLQTPTQYNTGTTTRDN